MRISLSWLREHVDLPPDLDAATLDEALVRVGLEVEEITDLRSTVSGPLVVGRVGAIEELTGLKKPIRYCQVDVGEAAPRGIICGARNFATGDLVVVALPGAVLPGGFAIAARKTYGRVSDGMICSGRELGISDDHTGIIVLASDVDAGVDAEVDAGVDAEVASGVDADAGARPGDEARALVGLDDIVVDLSVTPDRGYCLAVRGIARELAQSLGAAYTDPAAGHAPGGTAEPAYPVRVEDPAGCDRFATRIVRGVNPDAPTPAWLRRRLTVAGVRSISLPVDITNYLMLDLGQPMHAFDLACLRGELVVRRARPGERLTTLDGVQRQLDPEDMVICDAGLDETPVSLAAVMGGQTSEVQPSTVDVLFEAAHWDPVMVARTCRRHRLSSEAAKRWERGVDRELALPALEQAVALLTRYAGGHADERIGDLDTHPARRSITIDADLPSRVSGVHYEPDRVVEALRQIGCAVAPDGDRLAVTAPTWRPDLTDPVDLVEEVVRLDGYDKVPTVLPVAPPGNGLTAIQRRRRTVGRALAEAGYVEVLSYPFVGPAALDALGIAADDPLRVAVRLRNPISDEEPALRTSLLPPLLGALRRNIGLGLRDLALYEIGTVFLPAAAAAAVGLPPLPVDHRPTADALALAQTLVPRQPWHVAVVLAGEAVPAGWWGGGRTGDWADAIDAARLVAAAAGVAITVRAGHRAPWHPGRCAELIAGDDTVIGYAGELHPAACTGFDLPRRTCAMELDLDALPLAGVRMAPAISGFPPALIDVALVVDAVTPAAAVEAALHDGAGALLESLRLFDVYAGLQVGPGRKSLAYKLVFRAADRTLTVDDAVAARDTAVALAAQRCGASLRGA